MPTRARNPASARNGLEVKSPSAAHLRLGTVASVEALTDALDELAARTGFSGVVRVDRSDAIELNRAYGLADRAHEIPARAETRFAIASGTKGFTALTVMALIEDGTLALTTTARSVLGPDLPLIDDRVTIEHLLSHRSGIGDYFDETQTENITDYALKVPVHELATTEPYVTVLDGYETVFTPGERFAYCNGGYVVLALIAERTGGVPFHDLVRQRVCGPAGMRDTAFLRSDELPGDAAIGYLSADGPRTNVFHLPVRGSGDGGIYSTIADLSAFWRSLYSGAIIPAERVVMMLEPRSFTDDGEKRYGLGFWLHATSDVVWLTGYDAGVSFCSTHDPTRVITHTVISNTSEGAWPIVEFLDGRLGT
jgi:CubicO group peptidase (beta-lactamase class C family)